ncbi:MAG: hypothetical protein FJ023_03720 [Chloroflexi bacterium]|nr:hypothetical protein [Chloroflexota bacterium]
MKFMSLGLYDVAKSAEVAKAADQLLSNPPPGFKLLAQYVCLGRPFDGIPPNTMVSVAIGETDSAEAIAAVSYPLQLAGVTFYRVPLLEIPVAGATAVEKKLKG